MPAEINAIPVLDPQLVPHGWVEIAARLLLAMAIGAACGWERQRVGRAAGLRTYMLVAIGAAGFTMLGAELLGEMAGGPTSTCRERRRCSAVRSTPPAPAAPSRSGG